MAMVLPILEVGVIVHVVVTVHDTVHGSLITHRGSTINGNLNV
ncbi:hypothetical protein SLEP1_g3771 [Rubroshorea leprosula]|uniref:Uncharacterized protein n=1 Tax=Rubroshorea leprosula TaxID=152421 RepID=A0AAV5HM15_9ROSI|nr:hypothetical protein SLEP1_g3771 [Rubroshorea leprosula]